MNYLLDVNALVALGLEKHEFHGRISIWARSLGTSEAELATCSITELGFIRIVPQIPQYQVTLTHARELLLNLKTSQIPKVKFINDAVDLSQLPYWVNTARQTTDGHLLQLANANGLLLATLDTHIPESFLIPEN